MRDVSQQFRQLNNYLKIVFITPHLQSSYISACSCSCPLGSSALLDIPPVLLENIFYGPHVGSLDTVYNNMMTQNKICINYSVKTFARKDRKMYKMSTLLRAIVNYSFPYYHNWFLYSKLFNQNLYQRHNIFSNQGLLEPDLVHS